jgi:ABC-type transporter Mla subunit MlaD
MTATEEVIITTEPNNYPDADLQEVARQHNQAASAMRKLAAALDTIPRLFTEIGRLRARLARTLTDLHNLIAAARATSAHTRTGNPTPLLSA